MKFIYTVVNWLLMRIIIPVVAVYYIVLGYMLDKDTFDLPYGDIVLNPTYGLYLIAFVFLTKLGIHVVNRYTDKRIHRDFRLASSLYESGKPIKNLVITNDGALYIDPKTRTLVINDGKQEKEIPLADIESFSVHQGSRLIIKRSGSIDMHSKRASRYSTKPLYLTIDYAVGGVKQSKRICFLSRSRLGTSRAVIESNLVIVRSWYQFLTHEVKDTVYVKKGGYLDGSLVGTVV